MKKIIALSIIVLSIVAISILTKQQAFYHPEFSELPTSFGISTANAYTPTVGILGNSKNCLSCHTNNGQ